MLMSGIFSSAMSVIHFQNFFVMGLVTLGYVKECLKFYLDFLCKLCGQCFDIRYCHNDTFCFIRDVKGRHRNRDDVCPVIVNIFD